MSGFMADRPILGMTSALGRMIGAAKAREKAGERILHLERGEPNFDTPPHIVDALASAARAGETHYPDARGAIGLREVLVEKLRRENKIETHADDIVVTVGGTHALFSAFQATLAAGDELLVLTPYWMAIPKLVAFIDGAKYKTMPAYLELLRGTWTPDEFKAKLLENIGPNTKGIYLNSPHNPTGLVMSREQLQAVADVAIEKNLWVLSDEAYEHFVFDAARHVSIASLPGMSERTFSAFTFSKSYAMTGWRIGYLVSPPEMRGVIGPIIGFYSTHGVFPAVQSAAAAAVTGSQDCVEMMRRAYMERRDLLLHGLDGQSHLRVPTPSGAFYAFVDVSRARGERDIWALAEEWLADGVCVLPGTAFGKEYTDWVRISLVTKREDVEEAAKRLRDRYAAKAPSAKA